jgi:tetratricopeptide (TPR) repeat protein
MGHRLHWPYCVFILCLSAATEIRADEALWKLYVDRFQVYRRKGAFPEAEKAALAAIAEAEKSGAKSELAASWNNLGALYYDTGRYAERRNSSCVPSAARIIRSVTLR